jgi:hypothetical protein
MRDHEGFKRGFIWSNKAWYSRSVEDQEIMFGMYYDAAENDGFGGTSGEMGMRWYEIGGKNVPRLEAYDDGWSALSLFSDLIQELGNHDDENMTQEQFIEILKSCGFEDLTPYKHPYKQE